MVELLPCSHPWNYRPCSHHPRSRHGCEQGQLDGGVRGRRRLPLHVRARRCARRLQQLGRHTHLAVRARCTRYQCSSLRARSHHFCHAFCLVDWREKSFPQKNFVAIGVEASFFPFVSTFFSNSDLDDWVHLSAYCTHHLHRRTWEILGEYTLVVYLFTFYLFRLL